MKVRVHTNHRIHSIFRSKRLERKLFKIIIRLENEIERLDTNSVPENSNYRRLMDQNRDLRNQNKELTERNVCLSSQINVLKNESLDLRRDLTKFIFKENTNQLETKSDLMLLLESIRSDRNQLNQLFQTSNDFFNQMTDKISSQIEKVFSNEDKPNESNFASNEENISSTEVRPKSQMIYEMRQMSRQTAPQTQHQNDPQNEENQKNEFHLSDITEASQELSNEVINESHYLSVGSQFETPVRNDRNSFLESYRLTPQFTNSKLKLRTPSIFKFDSNHSFGRFRNESSGQSSGQSDETSLAFDQSIRPDFNLPGFDSFSNTITEEQNGMVSSTPVSHMHQKDIQRPSKRISSIIPFSPQSERPSLLEIQNTIESKRSKIESTNWETTDSKTNDSNVLSATQKRRKKLNTKSFNLEMSETSVTGNSTLRSSRRTRKPVCYRDTLKGRPKTSSNDWL